MTKPHPVSFNHPAYTASVKKWQRCRDTAEGSDAVKAAGDTYLPRLGSHRGFDGATKYEAYKKRALYFNAMQRTIRGLAGAAAAKDPSITSSNEEYAKVVVNMLRESCINEQLTVARVAIVVNLVKGSTMPTPTIWKTESVVNWKYERRDDSNYLTLLVLEEHASVDGDSIFEVKTETRRHVYRMLNGVCVYEMFVCNNDGTWALAIQPYPLAGVGRLLDHIPAIILGATGVDQDSVEEPLLLDLADVNISHYMNSADLEHGRHWTALPTAYAAGFPMVDRNGNPVEFSVGGESAWMTENTGATAGYLEFTGAGLGHLAQGMKDKQAMMAVLGARLLEEAKPAVEAADTIRMRLAGERSVLGNVVNASSQAMTWTLHEMIWWTNPLYEDPDDDDIITLNADFVDTKLTPSDLTALTAALQANGISYQTYFYCLKRGEIIPAERTIEEESSLIDAGRPGAPEPFANSGFGGFSG
ncbi:MAG: DUF4055 domain-containing protein [Hyphomicrobiaceae bacterium]|nr:MAG: DUF4055 domain-containing protein [Hyphomicrobiaceae bacterium]